MTSHKQKWISLGIVYFLWIIFYIHLHIHKVGGTESSSGITTDEEALNLVKNEDTTENSAKKNYIHGYKNNSIQLQKYLNKIKRIQPRSSQNFNINRSYRPYNDLPLMEPILFTSYVQQNNQNNHFFKAGENGNLPPTKFNINPSIADTPPPITEDVKKLPIISSSKAGRGLDEDSTISLRDQGVPMNVRPNAFFLSDDDFVMNGNTTLMPLAVPYTKNDNTKSTEMIISSISNEATSSSIIPTQSIHLDFSSTYTSAIESSFSSLNIKPTVAQQLSSSTIFTGMLSQTTTESIIPVFESSWNNLITESTKSNIQVISSAVLEVAISEISVKTTASFTNETDTTTEGSTTPYIMVKKPGDVEPDIITAPPFGSEVKTVNVSSEFGLGSHFDHKGQVFNADINANSANKPNQPLHPSSYHTDTNNLPENANLLPPSITTELPSNEQPQKSWDNANINSNPIGVKEPLANDYFVETKPDDPILETCTAGDDSSCDAKLDEVCRKENGISNCGCRLGSVRRKNNDICRRGRQFSTLLTLGKDGNNNLAYGPDFLSSGRLFVKTKNQVEKAVTNIYRGSEFRQYVIATKLNTFEPNGDFLVANTTITFDSAPMLDLEDVIRRLKRILTSSLANNNNRIGKSNLYVLENSEVVLDDINECNNVELNDCDKFAVCTNSIGSFSCKCKTGYKDPDEGSPDNRGRKCGGSCSNDYCNGHGECHLVDVDVKSCICHGSWSGDKCGIDGQVLGVAIGSSVVAFLIIMVTLILLIKWSRRSKEKVTANRTMSSSQSCNTFTYMKGPQYQVVGPQNSQPPERPPRPPEKTQPPLIRLSQESLNKESKWPKDPFEVFRGNDVIYDNLTRQSFRNPGHYHSPRSSAEIPHRPNIPPRTVFQQKTNFPVTEEDLSQYFGSKYNLTESEHSYQ